MMIRLALHHGLFWAYVDEELVPQNSSVMQYYPITIPEMDNQSLVC